MLSTLATSDVPGISAQRISTQGISTQADQRPCRLCGTRLGRSLIDLGCIPLANRTVAEDEPDQCFPLQVLICDSCMLAQISDVPPPQVMAPPRPFLFSRRGTMVEQARRFAHSMHQRLGLDRGSFVIDVGSSDGCLLRQFQALGMVTLGIEPVPQLAATANNLGVPTEASQFSAETAMEIAARQGCADLVVANDVLPHVPDLFGFVAGFAAILRPNGVVVLQVPHLLSLVQRLEFDAFRHDTYAYLSLQVLERIFRAVGLRVFDAERLAEHGGTLRIYACHAVSTQGIGAGLKAARQAEAHAQMDRCDFYDGFSERVAAARDHIAGFLRVRAEAGRRIAAYGAATRGTMLLNICGIGPQVITCVGDPDADKHGRLLPGSRIPVVATETLMKAPPDDLLILPWTHAPEISAELHSLRQMGTQFWTVIPRIARV